MFGGFKKIFVLTKPEYLIDSIKKCIPIDQNLFDLTKFAWISNKKVLLIQEKVFSVSKLKTLHI